MGGLFPQHLSLLSVLLWASKILVSFSLPMSVLIPPLGVVMLSNNEQFKPELKV